jgi:hypothetical protein
MIPGYSNCWEGKKAMFKTGSPILQEIIDDVVRRGEREGERIGKRKGNENAVIIVLVTRFGPEAEAVKAELKTIRADRLEKLIKLAAICPDLDSFRKRVAARTRQRGT